MTLEASLLRIPLSSIKGKRRFSRLKIGAVNVGQIDKHTTQIVCKQSEVGTIVSTLHYAENNF